MGTEPRMKSLLSVSLVLLSFSFSSTSRLPSERNDGCAESSPFIIKNGSPNAKKPYLTLDVGKNSLSGGKLSKKGNQGATRSGPGSTAPMETSSATVQRGSS